MLAAAVTAITTPTAAPIGNKTCATSRRLVGRRSRTYRVIEARKRRSRRASLLAVSAVGSLSALAVFSIDLAAAALLGRSAAPIVWKLVSPLPCVAATLLTFGFLPAPIGGYARPASISIGSIAYWAAIAASAER